MSGENVADMCLIEAEEKKSEKDENRWERREKGRQRSVQCGDHRHKRTRFIIEAFGVYIICYHLRFTVLSNSWGVGNHTFVLDL